ncbi:hypothetical protein [Stigmatella aurantiaca]|uniref:Conserved uncharacterized protein n=1 Tax=Stigmatella aurantiaca (strain DW4/3-1) TaxID=378806 RepID=Q08RP7_STIAD|nr:hypothetical protein [Stigmatella aurantiaca]ADO72039.1 conserved uncharacterized protein [Stigmatella aurantiaca DW4/3-1]EAU63150.1 hypothetical protein STIAU_6462 [Stigmatella aurantiaca DW4/3-1]
MSFTMPLHEIAGPWDKTEPVHENMTLLTLRTALEALQKANASYAGGMILTGIELRTLPNWDAEDYVDPTDAPTKAQEFLRGVTWPDDPKGWLFDSARGTTNYSSGLRWYKEFSNGSVSDDTALIKRSHYGDLQFIHAMAVQGGEAAAATKKKILEWSNFAIELALGKIDPETEIQQLPTRFESIQLFFRGHYSWKIKSLLAGNESRGKQLTKLDVRQRATGILLHLIQDSFSHSHVERKQDGSIQQFHDYGSQDQHKHSEKDHMGEGKTLRERMEHTLGALSAIDTGAKLVQLIDTSASIATLTAFLNETVFKLASSVAPAGPGANFLKTVKKTG